MKKPRTDNTSLVRTPRGSGPFPETTVAGAAQLSRYGEKDERTTPPT
jgi:hypothetical protein